LSEDIAPRLIELIAEDAPPERVLNLRHLTAGPRRVTSGDRFNLGFERLHVVFARPLGAVDFGQSRFNLTALRSSSRQFKQAS
jgi:hypothetical protein